MSAWASSLPGLDCDRTGFGIATMWGRTLQQSQPVNNWAGAQPPPSCRSEEHTSERRPLFLGTPLFGSLVSTATDPGSEPEGCAAAPYRGVSLSTTGRRLSPRPV